ncbi:hypothetical protein BH09ACT7_BH09ACT7_36340 [soil metagenome]
MAGVNLIPRPETTITDADVAGALGRAVQIIDPLLDVLWGTDPLGLKKRTHHLGAADGALDKVQDGVAWVLNTADVPGTSAWAEMDLDARIDWWVWRVGALDTIVVAFPGFLGAVGDRLPLQDLFGFTSQAIVLCALAREHGITDHDQQVRLLAAVLCDRDLRPGIEPDSGPPPAPEEPMSLSKVAHGLWGLMGLLAAIGDEVAKRPHARRFFRYLGMLPAIGAVVDYVGELGALVRAAKAGRRWIAQHPAVLTAGGRPAT